MQVDSGRRTLEFLAPDLKRLPVSPVLHPNFTDKAKSVFGYSTQKRQCQNIKKNGIACKL